MDTLPSSTAPNPRTDTQQKSKPSPYSRQEVMTSSSRRDHSTMAMRPSEEVIETASSVMTPPPTHSRNPQNSNLQRIQEPRSLPEYRRNISSTRASHQSSFTTFPTPPSPPISFKLLAKEAAWAVTGLWAFVAVFCFFFVASQPHEALSKTIAVPVFIVFFCLLGVALMLWGWLYAHKLWRWLKRSIFDRRVMHMARRDLESGQGGGNGDVHHEEGPSERVNRITRAAANESRARFGTARIADSNNRTFPNSRGNTIKSDSPRGNSEATPEITALEAILGCKNAKPSSSHPETSTHMLTGNLGDRNAGQDFCVTDLSLEEAVKLPPILDGTHEAGVIDRYLHDLKRPIDQTLQQSGGHGGAADSQMPSVKAEQAETIDAGEEVQNCKPQITSLSELDWDPPSPSEFSDFDGETSGTPRGQFAVILSASRNLDLSFALKLCHRDYMPTNGGNESMPDRELDRHVQCRTRSNRRSDTLKASEAEADGDTPDVMRLRGGYSEPDPLYEADCSVHDSDLPVISTLHPINPDDTTDSDLESDIDDSDESSLYTYHDVSSTSTISPPPSPMYEEEIPPTQVALELMETHPNLFWFRPSPPSTGPSTRLRRQPRALPRNQLQKTCPTKRGVEVTESCKPSLKAASFSFSFDQTESPEFRVINPFASHSMGNCELCSGDAGIISPVERERHTANNISWKGWLRRIAKFVFRKGKK